MGGRFVSESGRPKTEWRPLGAVNCRQSSDKGEKLVNDKLRSQQDL